MVKPIDNEVLPSAVEATHKAAERLLQCWDALHELEQLVDIEVTTSELADLVAGIDAPADCTRVISVDTVKEWLNKIADSAK